MDFLPSRFRCHKHSQYLLFCLSALIVTGAFFLGLFFVNKNLLDKYSPFPKIEKLTQKKEVLGFAPYWTLGKLDSVDWNSLTTVAYFSLPVTQNGTIDRDSYEWKVFYGEELADVFIKADKFHVKKIITLTQMDRSTIENFLNDSGAWDRLSLEVADILKERNLDGVNIDFEYIGANPDLSIKFDDFGQRFSKIVRAQIPNTYLTVSVLASAARGGTIYDVTALSKSYDGFVVMAYDFYYPGSTTIGPTAPLYGYNNGNGPFWYDVSTAVSDFLKKVDGSKIIMGVPYYGWNYPAYTPAPGSARRWPSAEATTNELADKNKLLQVTPTGGWDSQAQVSWRGYFAEDGWRVVYLEDKKSLTSKYNLVKNKNLKGVAVWALGYENGDDSMWSALRETFNITRLSEADKLNGNI